MEISLLFSMFFGPILTLIGLSLLINGKYYQKVVDSFAKSPALIYITSFMILILGLIIVVSHNIWVADIPVVITIFGWLALIKGSLLLLFPETMMKFTKKMKFGTAFTVSTGVIYLILGLMFDLIAYGVYV